MDPVAVVVAVSVLAALAFAIVAVLRLESPWLQPIAIGRAVLQLGLLSLVLTGVLADGVWVGVFLAVMVGAATAVVLRRARLPWRDAPRLAGVLLVAAAVPMTVVFATGALPLEPRYLLAVGGIVVGSTMTVSSLMGRSLAAALVTGRDEIEGWLALGATPRTAALRAVRTAASTALIPSTDQTRTTGIVTLPGAFVGAVFAGSPPLEAAGFQLIVLASILAAGAICVAALGWLLGAPTQLPDGGADAGTAARPGRHYSK
ncbi:ABC transporter permease [Promicromonospora sp. NPDC060204]|uniref:ABC transporter permease n=1 Tax=Promicromonospora sp. NPDC060204 TaxID=3347071 RepID=UPI003665FDCB